MRLALIADVHGNMPALEAVLADLRHRDADLVLNLGDSLSGPLWPGECCAMLMAAGMPTVRGNHDRWVATLDPAAMGHSDALAHAETSAEQRRWLGALPPVLRPFPGVLACHGRPDSDTGYLLEEVAGGRLMEADPAVVAARLGGTAGLRLVLCAHSHRPGMAWLPGPGITVLNPGSVGCPAYADPEGVPPHVSETRSPLARYALLDLGPDGAPEAVQHLALPYDWAMAARRAERQGSAVWAQALRTGTVPALA